MVKELKAVILGDYNVGKTTILRKIMNLSIYNVQTTIGLDIQKYEHQDLSINFWDTSGQEKFSTISKNYIKNSSLVLLVFDINRYETFMKIKDYWYNECKKNLSDENTFYFIIGNKMDLFREHPIHRYNINNNDNQKVYFISASNDNLDKLLLDIYRISLEIENKPNAGTIVLNDILSKKNKCCN
jgi:small GTP-binding protein